MKTAFTSRQLGDLIGTFERLGVDHQRFQAVRESRLLEALFNPEADLNKLFQVCQALGVPPEDCGMLWFEIMPGSTLLSLYASAQKACGGIERMLRAPLQDASAGLLGDAECSTGRYEAKVFDPGIGKTSFRTMRRRMLRRGWTPAEPEHQLAFLAKYPLEEWATHLVGLGSTKTVVTRKKVPFDPATGVNQARTFGRPAAEYRQEYLFRGYTQFLAVRKIA